MVAQGMVSVRRLINAHARMGIRGRSVRFQMQGAVQLAIAQKTSTRACPAVRIQKDTLKHVILHHMTARVVIVV